MSVMRSNGLWMPTVTWSSNGNHVISILQVDLKIPGGIYTQEPLLRTTTFVGYVPSNPSSALLYIKTSGFHIRCGGLWNAQEKTEIIIIWANWPQNHNFRLAYSLTFEDPWRYHIRMCSTSNSYRSIPSVRLKIQNALALIKSIFVRHITCIGLTNFNQILVTSIWFFSSTSMICINVKPKLICNGSDSFTTGRSSVLYESNKSCKRRFSLYPARHTEKNKYIGTF